MKLIKRVAVSEIPKINGSVVDTFNVEDKTTNAPSIRAVEEKLTYSTEEKQIGYWIDGKPIYRKVVEYNYATANTQVNIAPNLTNPKKIINFDYILDTGSAYMKTFGSDVTCYMSNTNIVYKANAWTGTVRIFIEYTKTTD